MHQDDWLLGFPHHGLELDGPRAGLIQVPLFHQIGIYNRTIRHMMPLEDEPEVYLWTREQIYVFLGRGT
jgi:hypothetical protein